MDVDQEPKEVLSSSPLIDINNDDDAPPQLCTSSSLSPARGKIVAEDETPKHANKVKSRSGPSSKDVNTDYSQTNFYPSAHHPSHGYPSQYGYYHPTPPNHGGYYRPHVPPPPPQSSTSHNSVQPSYHNHHHQHSGSSGAYPHYPPPPAYYVPAYNGSAGGGNAGAGYYPHSQALPPTVSALNSNSNDENSRGDVHTEESPSGRNVSRSNKMNDNAKGIKKKSSNNSDLRTMATSSAKKRHKKQQKHKVNTSSLSSSPSKNFYNHNDDVTHLQSRQPTNDTTSSMSNKQPSRDHLHDRHFNQSASADDSSLSLCSNSNGPPRFNGCGSLDSLSDVASVQEPIALPKDYRFNKVSKSSKRSKRPLEDEESYEKRTNQQQPPKQQPPIKYNSSPLSLRSHSPSGTMLEIPNIPSITSSRTSESDITVPKPHRLKSSSFSIPIRTKPGTNVHRKKCAAANFYNPTMSEDDEDDDNDDRSARGTKNAVSSFTNRPCPSWEFNANGSFELQDHGSSLFTMTNLLPSFSWGETRQNSHSFDNTSVAMRSNGSGNNSVMMKLDESRMTHDDDDGINYGKHEKQKQQQQEEEDAIITDAVERQDLVKKKKKKKRVSINRDEHADKQRVNHKLIFTKEKKSDKIIKNERAFHKPNSYKSASSSKSKRDEPKRCHPLSCSSASNSSSQKSSTSHQDTNAWAHTSPHHPPAMDSMGSHYGNIHPPPPPPHGYHGYPSPYHHPYSNGYVPPPHMMYAPHPIPHHHPYTIPYESRSDHNSPHQSSSAYTNDRNYAAFCPPPTSMAVPQSSKQRSYLIPRNCGSSAVNMEGNDASALQPRSQPPNLSNFIGRGVYNWTKEEDLRLSTIMKKYKNTMDWDPIAKEHARGKTPKECHERWIRYLKPGVRKGQWQDHEDAIVVEAVSNSTEQPFTRWSDLAQRLPGRVGKQIRDRWVNHLNPHINHMPFSKEDDKLLYKGYLDAGKKWVEISTKYFNSTRSENHIKNRWYSASFKKFITAEYGPDAYTCSRTNKSDGNQVKDSCQSSKDIKVESTANKVSLS